MLSTDKTSLIYCNSLLAKLSYGELSPVNCSHYHLYILSDDKIKEGDWYCFPLFKGGYKIKQYNSEQHFNEKPCITLATLKAMTL